MAMKTFAAVAVAVLLTVAARGAEKRVPVLLELFTSEGCSSCPPADQLLEKLDRDQPISGADLIVLSEHVDYWNHDGWTDPYSSNDFTHRQQAYATQFGIGDIYTPQLIVDGGKPVVGGNGPDIARAIDESVRTAKIPVKVSAAKSEKGLRVHIEAPALEGEVKGLVYLAIAANHAQSHVTSGENSGRELGHTAVVLSLRQIAKISAKEGVSKDVAAPVNVKFQAGDTRVVVFVEDARTHRVLGAARADISR